MYTVRFFFIIQNKTMNKENIDFCKVHFSSIEVMQNSKNNKELLNK